MAFKLTWSPSARQDLRDIAEYIAEDNPVAARRFVETLFKAVERLIDFPESGRTVPEFGDSGVREIIRKPFRIVHRINRANQTIDIVRVWHAARGVPIVP